MDKGQRARAVMVGIGILAGLALYAWVQIAQDVYLAERSMLVGVCFTAVFFGTLLAIAPRLDLRRAAGFAAALAASIAALIWLTSLRYDSISELAVAGFPALAVFMLVWLPLPFLIAAALGNWRDYAALFDQSWGIVLRFAIAVVLALAVWALILLSDQLLGLVGLAFLHALLDFGPAHYLITGAAFGLGIAVSAEALAPKGAGLALLLLRPLLPPIAAVVALFLLALPMRGLSNLFGDLSAAMTLLAILAVAATLITSVVDTTGAAATRSRVLVLSARIMAVMMLVLGLLAAYAIWLRVSQYGWTPARIYGALAAFVGVGYGALYAWSAVRADWMAGIRRTNIALALTQIAIAALSLTPLLNAERISTASQMARFEDGRTAVETLDVMSLGHWGVAGKAALNDLTDRSKQKGQEALAQRLNNPIDGIVNVEDASWELRVEVVALMPLQPRSARAAQSLLLQNLPHDTLAEIRDGCARKSGDLTASCAMLVADFLPQVQGDEGVIALIGEGGDLQLFGLTQDANRGNWAQTQILGGTGFVDGAQAIAALREWQSALPALTPAPIMQLPLGDGGVILLP